MNVVWSALLVRSFLRFCYCYRIRCTYQIEKIVSLVAENGAHNFALTCVPSVGGMCDLRIAHRKLSTIYTVNGYCKIEKL